MSVALFYLVLALLALVEPQLDSAWWPVFALLAFVLFARMLYRRSPKAFALMSIMALTKALVLIALIPIAAGIWIVELATVVHGPVYSFYFCLLSCLFVHTGWWTTRVLARTRLFRSVIPLDPNWSVFIAVAAMAIVAAMTLVLVATGVAQGFALLSGVDRFVYRSQSGYLFNFVITFKPVLAAMLGAVRSRLLVSRTMRGICDAQIAIIAALAALFGDKFLSLIVLVIFYLLPLVIFSKKGRRFRISAGVRLAALALMPTVTALTVFVYSDYGSLSWGATTDRLFGRFTGQGQLWYAAMRAGNDLIRPDAPAIGRLRHALGFGGAGDPLHDRIGIFYLVDRFAPPNVYANIIKGEGFVQFVAGFESYLLLIGGHLPMILGVIGCGLLAGLACAYLYNAMLARSVLGVGAAAFIYMAVLTMTNSAAIWLAVGLRALLYAAVVVAADLIFRAIVSQRSGVVGRQRSPARPSPGYPQRHGGPLAAASDRR